MKRKTAAVEKPASGGTNANSNDEASSLKFKEKPPAFKHQKIFTRIVISCAVFVFVYFTSKKEKNVTFGGINENIQIREQKLDCPIENISNEPALLSNCQFSTCGRFVSDQIIAEDESNALKNEIGKLFGNEKISSITKTMTGENYDGLKHIIEKILPKILQTFSEKFNVLHHDSLVLSEHSFIAKITNVTTEFSERVHQSHHDSEIDGTIQFSLFIFLSTFKKDFTEGKHVFIDIEKNGKKKNKVVESKLGRIVGFSSGRENVHLIQNVKEGALSFLKLLFISNKETCEASA